MFLSAKVGGEREFKSPKEWTTEIYSWLDLPYSVIYNQERGNISSRFSNNTEAFAWVLLENLEDRYVEHM